eukprot:Clim_evm99s172 gene=Clim_evmTU99s172
MLVTAARQVAQRRFAIQRLTATTAALKTRSMSSHAHEPTEAGDFGWWCDLPTRWMDNDIYGHVNNVVYYSYFDTIVNRYLIQEGGLDIQEGKIIGVCVESGCKYKSSVEFPDVLKGGLRIRKLGNSSVTYECGIFKTTPDGKVPLPDQKAAAYGHFTHVFVDRPTMKPVSIPDNIRAALEKVRHSGAPKAKH